MLGARAVPVPAEEVMKEPKAIVKPESSEAEASPPSKKRRLDPNALKSAMSRTGGDSLASSKGMPRRQATFPVLATECAPGIFDEDFELTIRSLPSHVELEQSRRARGDSNVLGHLFARASIHAMNGQVLDVNEGELDWLWEALSSSGRQLVMGMFAKTCTVSDEAQKNALSGLRLD
jgi:hypothetical protein